MSAAPDIQRLKVVVQGAVQGVGFRPFVFHLAEELELSGYVSNFPGGVCIEVEGIRPGLEDFLNRLQVERPPRSIIQSLETWWLDPLPFTQFEIRQSTQAGAKTALVTPDIATCEDCLQELLNPDDRRYGYPFINCTNCGPRFSIIEALPYDRVNTSMKRFKMCPRCQSEYDSPHDRRFHAQPNACPECGPHTELWDGNGRTLASSRESADPSAPLRLAAEALHRGAIVAVKSVGGFHLMVIAHDAGAVRTLRSKKHREDKPFAVMFPSLAGVQQTCEVSDLENRLLRSPEAPIVLLRRLPGHANAVSSAVAPGNPYLGCLLPSNPLQHLLLCSMKVPVVATSGNITDEPICIDEREAVDRLQGIADFFLVHDRPIVRHVDDSVLRVVAGRELMLRRARGFAPLPITIQNLLPVPQHPAGVHDDDQSSTTGKDPETPQSEAILAVGAQLKSSVALAIGSQVFVSQHIGDLETVQAAQAFQTVVADLQRLYDSPATAVVTDLHPNYLSTTFAKGTGMACRSVQHHVAHVLSCMGENQVQPPALGVAWDGTGYGLDGTVWGGEFLTINEMDSQRVAHFRTFSLPGSELAIREPRRSALGMLFEMFGLSLFAREDLPIKQAFSSAELPVLGRMLTQKINSPRTSSVGRLFDGMASLLQVRQVARFEGQAAMELEFLSDVRTGCLGYPLRLDERSTPWIIDWAPAIEAVLTDCKQGVPAPRVAARFHQTLVDAILLVANRVGLERVVLSGGCFQNRFLTEACIQRLKDSSFRPYWHQRVPPNDGGICLGQVIAARWWKV